MLSDNVASSPVSGGFPFSPMTNEKTPSPLSEKQSSTSPVKEVAPSVRLPVRASTVIEDQVLPDTIPPRDPNRARTLVLCFDGTGDQFDEDNSNIVQFFSMLKKDSRTEQMVYYQAGIGTYTKDTFATPIGTKIAKYLDEAIAWYLDQHVKEGYHFLMQNYSEGDKICLFGFSRGAYTARALAGMIHKVGLLPADNAQQVPFAWNMYTRTDDMGWEQSRLFKKSFSIDVDISFIGVFDTVCSVGLFGKTLPFTASNYAVRVFRHAVSLDERRAKFKANHFSRPTDHEEWLAGEQGGERHSRPRTDADTGKPSKRKEMEKKFMDRETPTDAEEVWFAGCHCDVGGGNVKNGTPNALARIPLRWMVRECFKAKTGIQFDTETFKEIGLDPRTLYPEVIPAQEVLRPLATLSESPTPSRSSTLVNGETPNKSTGKELSSYVKRSGSPASFWSEAEETFKDAISEIFDQLVIKWTWWILELIPIKHKYQRSDKTWASYYSWNLGTARFIPRQRKGFKVHSSVRTRMQVLGYKPAAEFHYEPTWVD